MFLVEPASGQRCQYPSAEALGAAILSIVEPGDELTLTCQVEAVRGPIGKGRVEARVGDELAVRGTLTFAAQ